MKKYQPILLVVYLGFMSASYAGSQLTETDCHYLYTPHATDWDFIPASDPTTAIGAQCILFDYGGNCPDGRHHRCCLGVGGLSKAPDTDYLGGVSRIGKDWLLYKVYSTKADLFRAVDSGEIREAYEKCLRN
ncbi:hypothetical protein [Endozoicomonas sp. 8E]|uniref:hypothetical protein n=1 Tax=Endozoicomonas sp. 8E TaxID=3035692 RepID=UPI002939342F|nr:hypothetical protein [Endozoicomonas sp. 8E]WOG29668.1 hypothetical protein P6910_08435 [Endozoicomonas sp. 8E]